MPDSWEFALSHAEGQFVTFLCDDDAIAPELLVTVAQVIEQCASEAITWAFAGYYHPNWDVAEQRNSATVPPVCNNVESLRSRPALCACSPKCGPSFPVPKMLQSCCSRRVLDEIREHVGRLFVPTCPDLSSPTRTLDAVPQYVHIDRILIVSGAAMESTGARQSTKDRANIRKFAMEFGPNGMFQEVPIQVLVGMNFVADTLLRVKRLLGPRLQDIELNWERYAVTCFESLSAFEKLGADTASEMQGFHEVLGRQPIELQRKVWRAIKKVRPAVWRQAIRATINKTSFLSELELMLRPKVRASKPRIICGEEGGFGNIVECGAKMTVLTSDGRRQLICA
jgi:hypothetical protein